VGIAENPGKPHTQRAVRAANTTDIGSTRGTSSSKATLAHGVGAVNATRIGRSTGEAKETAAICWSLTKGQALSGFIATMLTDPFAGG